LWQFHLYAKSVFRRQAMAMGENRRRHLLSAFQLNFE